MFSKRSDFIREPNALSRALGERRPRFDLTLSNPTIADLPFDDLAIGKALDRNDWRLYEPSPRGLPLARHALAAHLSVDPARLLITSSTSEAYALLLKLCCDPGDTVLIAEPSYPLLSILTRMEGVVPVGYRLAYDGSWYIDRNSVLEAMKRRPKLVFTVSPNNPTGSFLSHDDLRFLLELGAPVVCDEVFADYDLRQSTPRRAVPTQAEDGLVVSLGGLSKFAGLPQLKLSWMVLSGADERVVEALERLEFMTDAHLCVATPVQRALPDILRLASARTATILGRVRKNLAFLREALRSCPTADLLDVEGGWYGLIRLPRVRDEEHWVLSLLAHEVLVHPGWLFDFEDEAYAVVSLLVPEPVFREGVAILAHVVDEATAQDAGCSASQEL